MLRYILTRTVWVFIMLCAIVSVNFLILKLAPSYAPVTEEDRQMYYNKQVSDGYMTLRLITEEEEMETIRYQISTATTAKGTYYEDKGTLIRAFEPVPISQQYFVWVSNVLTKWDWGTSTRVEVGRPVWELIASRMPTTMTLNIIALFFYIPIGISLGGLAALKKDKLIDNIISFCVMIMVSIPGFVVMILLVMTFGYTLEWVPTIYPASDAATKIRLMGMILPVAAMTFSPIASLTRVTRAELTEVLTSEYLLLARTKGLTRKQAIVRHALRNSFVPLVPGIIYSFVGILSGSVVIEAIYSIPGTGTIFIRALTRNSYDYNLILASTAFYTFVGLFAVLVVDLSYGLVDPRIRMGGRK